jgi:hypothetical protein
MLTFSKGSRLIVSFHFLLVIFLFLTSCTSVKPATTKGGMKFFETFFVGNEGTQYFIKPMAFQNEDKNTNLQIDFTFRYKDKVRDTAIVNFSIFSTTIYKSVDGLTLSNGKTGGVFLERAELVFNEKTKKGFVSRFSTRLPLKSLKQTFDQDNWIISVHQKEQLVKFFPEKKTKKKINTLRENVFSIM